MERTVSSVFVWVGQSCRAKVGHFRKAPKIHPVATHPATKFFRFAGLGLRKALPGSRVGADWLVGGVGAALAWWRSMGAGRRGREHSAPAMVKSDWRALYRWTSD